MVRSVLYLTARAGAVPAIVDLYRRERILERALEQDGCLACELQLPRDGDGPVLVTALWRDAAAYDGWVANPWRKASAPMLADLVDGEFDGGVRGAVYDVEIAVGAPAAADSGRGED